MRAPTATLSLLFALFGAIGCGGSEKKVEEPKPEVEKPKPREESKTPNIEYDLGMVSPDIAKRRFGELKGMWNDCYLEEHKTHEVLAGKVTLTIRTNKDGSVKWVYVTDSDLGNRKVEKCMLDAVRSLNWGKPMDAREGEIPSHTFGWELDDDDRPADVASSSNVLGPIGANKGKIAACKKDSKAKFTVTLYVQKNGKPKSVGVATDDPSGEEAADCIADVLGKLTYTNRSSWTTKVTVTLP
jgi:hypothetical protein